MATPSGISSGVGFRYLQVFALDTNGIIAATSTTAMYTGVQVSGARAMTVNDPEPIQIVHIGDDRPYALDVLPPKEPITGEVRVTKQNDVIDGILTANKQVTLGDMKLFPIGTDRRGDESQVCILAYREGEETDPSSANFGARNWQMRLFPRSFLIPREGSFDDNPEERPYTFRPQFATKYPWGVSFSTTTEGGSMAQGLRGVSEYKPVIGAYKTDNTQTSFTLSPAATGTAKISVFLVNSSGVGAASTPTTVGTGSLVYTTAPTTGTLVIIYEKA